MVNLNPNANTISNTGEKRIIDIKILFKNELLNKTLKLFVNATKPNIDTNNAKCNLLYNPGFKNIVGKYEIIDKIINTKSKK